jgi:hypothetical protein
MNRRSLLGFLATLPFVGTMFKSDDGVALTSIANPGRPWLEWRPENTIQIHDDALETVEIDLPVYAHAGEVVTCENGHEICTFKETVMVGQIQELDRQIGDFRQERPKVGDMLPLYCTICGARWAGAWGTFHFKGGWRLDRPRVPLTLDG